MQEQSSRSETISAGRLNYDGDPRPIPAPDQMMGNAALPKPDNNIRNIQITQLNHGYVVVVGCQHFAIESSSTLIAKLSEYILNPAETEQKWSDKKLF